MRILLAVILLVFLAAVAVFAVQNMLVVKLSFLNWSVNAPLALMIVLVYFLGMLSGWTVVAFVRSTLRQMTERRQNS